MLELPIFEWCHHQSKMRIHRHPTGSRRHYSPTRACVLPEPPTPPKSPGAIHEYESLEDEDKDKYVFRNWVIEAKYLTFSSSHDPGSTRATKTTPKHLPGMLMTYISFKKLEAFDIPQEYDLSIK